MRIIENYDSLPVRRSFPNTVHRYWNKIDLSSRVFRILREPNVLLSSRSTYPSPPKYIEKYDISRMRISQRQAN